MSTTAESVVARLDEDRLTHKYDLQAIVAHLRKWYPDRAVHELVGHQFRSIARAYQIVSLGDWAAMMNVPSTKITGSENLTPISLDNSVPMYRRSDMEYAWWFKREGSRLDDNHVELEETFRSYLPN
jgi:hypothetical protein